jgi:peptidoglycan/LPS O-acetylase OafA/YrhL
VGEQPRGSRYDHIDALRAFAALLVLWRHAEGLFDPAGLTAFGKWAFSFIDPGRVGVVLFFAVSGFVIPSSLQGTRVEGTRKFLIRRFFRLYPAYWLSIPIGWLAIHWLGGEPLAPLTIIANTTMLHELFGFPDVIGVYWTLVLELAFYALCLIFFWFGIVHRSMTFCVLTVMAALGAYFYSFLARDVNYVETNLVLIPQIWYKIIHYVDPNHLFGDFRFAWLLLYDTGHYVVADPSNLWGNYRFVWPIYLSVMGLGALTRFWHDGRAGILDKIVLVAVVGRWLIFFLIIPVTDYVAGRIPRAAVCTFLSYSVPIVGFFVLACVCKIHSRLLSYLGLISYSLYLFHAVIIFPLRVFLQQHPSSVFQSEAPWLLVIIVILLSVVLAAAIFKLIEKPAIELGRRLTSPPTEKRRMSDRIAAAGLMSAPVGGVVAAAPFPAPGRMG